jgi:hypothetical protein
VKLSLCRDDGVYDAGGTLTAHWRVSRVPLEDVQGLEVSVLWHTEGKGDEDLHVHHFHRLGEQQIRRVGLAEPQSIRCTLPATPLSYHGRLISVRWCIRLRLFLAKGREIVAEQPFHLVSPATLLSPLRSVVTAPAEPTADAGELGGLGSKPWTASSS